VSPAAVLRERLAEARGHGLSFTDAWPLARDEALQAASHKRDRGEWSIALNATVGDWRAAFDRAPGGERATALRVLGEGRGQALSARELAEVAA